jgi:glutathione reductase (NADPH)
LKNEFDLIVIGGGSGGLASAQRAAEYGKNVALIEKAPLGGTCVNLGCVPKKIMWYASHLVHQMEIAEDYGFNFSSVTHEWEPLKKRRDEYIKRLNLIYEKNLNKHEITLIKGEARLEDRHTVCVSGESFKAEHIIIATGGQPIIPDIVGANYGITSDGFFELEEKPKNVCIVGSGYIAVEFAGMLSALGTNVTMNIRTESILRSFDSMLSENLKEIMTYHEVKIQTGKIPESIEIAGSEFILKTTDGEESELYDSIIWAIGRSPCTEDLNLSSASVQTDKYGYIPVDKFQKTNIENIFAIGDVIGKEQLTPVAIAAGRRLSDRLYGGMKERYLDYEMIPTVVFSHPTIGTIGMTEKEAREKYNNDIKIYISVFNPMFYALSRDEKKIKTSMKLITQGHDERIIGCHIIGEGADEMLQGFAVAIKNGATKKDFDDTVAIHPTSAEELVTMR